MMLSKRSLPSLLLILANAAWAGQESQAIERRVYVCPAWEEAVKLTDVGDRQVVGFFQRYLIK